MSVSSRESKSDSLKKSGERKKIGELRVLLTDFDENCQKYIGAEDEKLLSILRIKSFDVKKAASAIQTHENFKQKYSEIFLRPFEEWKKTFEDDIVSVLRNNDSFGRKVLYVKAKNWHPGQLTLEALCHGTFQFLDQVLLSEDTQINGVGVIINLKNVGFKQMAKQIATMGVRELIRGNEVIKGGVIIKVKSLYILNAPTAVTQVMKVFKLILNKKFKDRMHFCNTGSEEFHSAFSNDKLPESLGGILTEEEGLDVNMIKNIFANRN